jgi:hypothetical protein
MPSSAEGAREAAVALLVAIERSCLDLEAAFVERRWAEANASLVRQHALTAELGRLFARAPETAPERDDKIAQRVRGILTYRDDQLRRVTAYNDEVSRRLQSIGRVRRFSRSIGSGAAARLLDGQY